VASGPSSPFVEGGAGCPWMLVGGRRHSSIVEVDPRSQSSRVVVGAHCILENKRGRRGRPHTSINMKGDNEMCHRLRRPSSFVRWAGDEALPHCRYHWGGWRRLNEDCGRWWLVVTKQRWSW
jgi:hypothetical protein